jgi:hypothetical protein
MTNIEDEFVSDIESSGEISDNEEKDQTKPIENFDYISDEEEEEEENVNKGKTWVGSYIEKKEEKTTKNVPISKSIQLTLKKLQNFKKDWQSRSTFETLKRNFNKYFKLIKINSKIRKCKSMFCEDFFIFLMNLEMFLEGEFEELYCVNGKKRRLYFMFAKMIKGVLKRYGRVFRRYKKCKELVVFEEKKEEEKWDGPWGTWLTVVDDTYRNCYNQMKLGVKRRNEIVRNEREWVRKFMDDEIIGKVLAKIGGKIDNKYFKILEDMKKNVKCEILLCKILLGMLDILVNQKCFRWYYACECLLKVFGIIERRDDLEFRKVERTSDRVIRINNELYVYVKKIGDEFCKILMKSDPTTLAYVRKLEDEKIFFNIVERCYCYYVNLGIQKDLTDFSGVVLKMLFLLHTRRDDDHKKIFKNRMKELKAIENVKFEEMEEKNVEKDKKKGEKNEKSEIKDEKAVLFSLMRLPQKLMVTEELRDTVERLVEFIMVNSTNQNEVIQTSLFKMFYRSVNDRYGVVRDLFLKSNIQKVILQDNIRRSTKIAFNRCAANIGICAFKCGYFKDANNILHDIYLAQNKNKLLHQYIFDKKAEENERLSLIIPFHMQINMDLLESIFLITLIILEVSSIFTGRINQKRRITFQKFMNFNSKTYFISPSDSKSILREAALQLQKSNWQKSYNLICRLEFWKYLHNKEKLKKKILTKLKVAGLISCLHQCTKYFRSIKLKYLVQKFEISKSDVEKILYRMIADTNFNAVVQEDGFIYLKEERELPKKYQSLYVDILGWKLF